MKNWKLLFLSLVMALLAACSRGGAERYEPAELFAEIQRAVEIPAMVDVAGDFLEAETGIQASDYESAVYYLLEEGLAPDEIVIIKAKDQTSADTIREKLAGRLAYKEKSAQLYLTEYMPVIQAGVIRQDGLTVSLIVSEQVDEIVEVYDRYGK